MFITVVNNKVTHCCPSLAEIVNTMRELDPYAASYVEGIGNGCEVLRRASGFETGEGITPANLDKYRHKIG